MTKRAILFGIDYVNSMYPLYGCSNDARNMKKLFEDLKFDDIQLYTEQTTPKCVTMAGITKILFELIRDSHISNLSMVALHFSGHGTHVTDDGIDEIDGMDEMIAPVDYKEAGYIKDDWLRIMLSNVNKNTRVICTFDCCYSGSMCDLQYTLQPTGTPVYNPIAKPIECNIIMISACQDSELASEAFTIGTGYSGVLTTFLIKTIRDLNPIGNEMNVMQIVDVIAQLIQNARYNQIPIISSSRQIVETTTIY
jgi:hypothetical protein